MTTDEEFGKAFAKLALQNPETLVDLFLRSEAVRFSHLSIYNSLVFKKKIRGLEFITEEERSGLMAEFKRITEGYEFNEWQTNQFLKVLLMIAYFL